MARRRHRGAKLLRDLPVWAPAVPPSNGDHPMPAPPWHQTHYPGKAHLLRHAAAEGQLVFVKCLRCQRQAVYLASDLVGLLNPDRDALDPPFPCSRCRSAEHIRVECRIAYSDEIGNLVVRRPGRSARPAAGAAASSAIPSPTKQRPGACAPDPSNSSFRGLASECRHQPFGQTSR